MRSGPLYIYYIIYIIYIYNAVRSILVVHGGVGPGDFSLRDIAAVPRPIQASDVRSSRHWYPYCGLLRLIAAYCEVCWPIQASDIRSSCRWYPYCGVLRLFAAFCGFLRGLLAHAGVGHQILMPSVSAYCGYCGLLRRIAAYCGVF